MRLDALNAKMVSLLNLRAKAINDLIIVWQKVLVDCCKCKKYSTYSNEHEPSYISNITFKGKMYSFPSSREDQFCKDLVFLGSDTLPPVNSLDKNCFSSFIFPKVFLS
jgi:hypothetical protein